MAGSAPATRTALVVGATGLTGGHLVSMLLNHSAYDRVYVYGRRSIGLKHDKLVEIQGNYASIEADLAECRADDVYCCLGTTIKVAGSQEAFYRVDHDYPLAVARTMLAQGASHFLLVSALGADAGSKIFYNRVKGEVEQHIADLAYPSFTIFQPSLLLGERQERRLGEKLGAWALALIGPLMIGPLLTYKAIDSRRVAKAMMQHALAAAESSEPQGVRTVSSAQMQQVDAP